MNLLVDSGNTFTKVAICDEHKIHTILRVESREDFLRLKIDYRPTAVLVSTVNKEGKEIIELFPESKTILLDHTTPIPIQNLYQTPSTLGMDRLADAVGAYTLFPAQHCLCIDAGTCLKYDFINLQGQYLGGGISPGLEMRFKALHTFTAKLPLIQGQSTFSLTGNTTEGSILSGVQVGALKEVEGVINEYKSRYKGLKIIITGGDAGFFESRIKETIFAAPDLLFLGLKRILEYNVS
jgi:type III pantothenate kinase